MRNLEKLNIWKKALSLCEDIYQVTDQLPESEKFGLTSQIRRASVSIPSNIAEGAGRNSNKEFIQFLSVANGSSYEVQTQLILATKLNYINKNELDPILSDLEEIQKMNFGLQNHLKNTQSSHLTTQN